MSDHVSGYLDLLLPLLFVAVIFVFGVVVGMGLCWLLA